MISVMSLSLQKDKYDAAIYDSQVHVQHPGQTTVKLRVDTLQVGQGDLLLQDHLVETDNEVGVQESSMEDTQAQASPDELEVVKMLWVDARSGVNLQGVVVVCGVLEETVEGVEHFVGKQEEKFSVTLMSKSTWRRLSQIINAPG